MSDLTLSMRPSQIVWKAERALDTGAQFAAVLGDSSKPGRYVFRLRVPAGHKAMPHTHPDERVYTVLSGTFHLGFGDRFSDARLEVYPEGSVVLIRAGRHHFQVAKSGEYEVQVEGLGPSELVYVDPKDDPRTADAEG